MRRFFPMPRGVECVSWPALCSLLGLLVCAEGKSVAVIGGGIGGATVALELLDHPDRPNVTIFEAHGTIGNLKSASGIIAASLIFNSNTQYWQDLHEPDDFVELMRTMAFRVSLKDTDASKFKHTIARYALTKDPRIEKANQDDFFTASRARLDHIVDLYPQLCVAIIGPMCCRQGSAARAWMDTNDAGRCDRKPRGWAHTFFTEDDWSHADNLDAAKKGNWQIFGRNSELYNQVAEFLMEEDFAGVLFNDQDLGFVRVEDLFPVIADIVADSGRGSIRTMCKVSSISLVEGSGGPLKVHLDDSWPVKGAGAGGRRLAEASESAAHCGTGDELIFDSVVVSAGANSVNVVANQDVLIKAEILPVKGFACATDAKLINESLLDLGVQDQERSHYIRPQKNGGVRYGFGKHFADMSREVSEIDPQFEEAWLEKKAGIKATELGRKVMLQNDTQRLAGIRPLSALGNFPLIKTYPEYPGLILTTGYGWHGFTMAWKSAQLAAELAVGGAVAEESWAFAVDGYTGCTAWYDVRCWGVHQRLTAIAAALIIFLAWPACKAVQKPRGAVSNRRDTDLDPLVPAPVAAPPGASRSLDPPSLSCCIGGGRACS